MIADVLWTPSFGLLAFAQSNELPADMAKERTRTTTFRQARMRIHHKEADSVLSAAICAFSARRLARCLEWASRCSRRTLLSCAQSTGGCKMRNNYTDPT